MTSSITIETARRADFLTARHGILNVAQIVAAHAALFFLFYLLGALPLWAGTIPALVASWVHQRFLSEWVHEAAHYNLVADKTWNDILANALLCWWHGYRIEGYRTAHMRHHSADEYFASGDPDTEKLSVKSKKELRRALLKDLSGYTAVTTYLDILFTGKASSDPLLIRLGNMARFLIPVAILHLTLIFYAWLGGFLVYYFVYMLSLVTIYTLLNRIRVYGQHLAITEQGVIADATKAERTIDAGVIDRVFITSALMLYHHEHHARPALPFRALAAVSQPHADPNRYMKERWPLLFRFLRSLP